MKPTRLFNFLLGAALLFGVLAVASASAQVGRRLSPEMRHLVDAVTGVSMLALTTDPASDAKPYQTHPTWTADGEWIIFRSNRDDQGNQAYLVHAARGDIIQLTAGPDTGTGSLNLANQAMKLYYMRGGPRRGPAPADARPETPRQLVELDLARLIPDALADNVAEAARYERIVATLPADLRDSGGFAIDAADDVAYWGVAPGPAPAARPATAETPTSGNAASIDRRNIDQKNTNPSEAREAARQRFAEAGRGPGGIRRIDLATGEITTVIDVDLRMGHVQANPYRSREIIYCHETTGDAPQRMWAVNADGSDHRPLYVESPDEWVTHETVSGPDEVMFNIMGHLPYLRERPTGVAVLNLRTRQMKILGQMEETMERGGTGGFWHCNGSPDHRWAVADNFAGTVTLIDRTDGRQIPLSTGHKMRPDHTHPIFSPDSRHVLVQSGLLSDGKQLDLILIPVPVVALGTPTS